MDGIECSHCMLASEARPCRPTPAPPLLVQSQLEISSRVLSPCKTDVVGQSVSAVDAS